MIIGVSLVTLSCGNETARSPSPLGFRWPDRFAYGFEYVSETKRDGQLLVRYDERKTVRFEVREDRYLVSHDSVLKVTSMSGRPTTLEAYWPEDTLQFYVKLGPLGEIANVEPGCDPAVPACADALSSALPLELRHIIPRLPVWPAPAGATWTDSLAYDDASRSRGSRGYVLTHYRSAGDTVVAARAYWVIRWNSVRHAFRNEGGALGIAADPPLQETGAVFVDKEQLTPAYAVWAGALAAPPELRAMGVTGSGFRGRAYIPGSTFDPRVTTGW
ncbi:MAG: hypothetical protein Q7J79_04975 [Gemmatimonadales bacterium]|nr:hypothetical protein [Gemmatimonadales bacterium]